MTIRSYSSPEAFKQALEQRLRASTRTGPELARRRQLLVFDRFLARIFAVLGDAVTLKGGLVLELRLERARATKDVDIRVTGSPDDILAKLQEAGSRALGDFMTFEIAPDDDHPEIQNDGMPYEGLRFRAECKLAGKLYASRFGVDVAFGDPILGEPDVAVAEDILSFVGIKPPTLRLPQAAWLEPYAAMARENQLVWPTLVDVTSAAKAFLDPILVGGLDATWDPPTWMWISR